VGSEMAVGLYISSHINVCSWGNNLLHGMALGLLGVSASGKSAF
jgi:hypothetical protein